MIALFTDFGNDDIYVGQVKAALRQSMTAAIDVIDLLHSAPAFYPEAGAHLLAALQAYFPAQTVFLAVVDPGVGGARAPVVVEADSKWFIGPDNGLLSVVASRAKLSRVWRIAWHPECLSPSFHGRDLFAPIAAWIASNEFPRDKLESISTLMVQLAASDLAEVIYIDHYGNVLTGIRAMGQSSQVVVEANGHRLNHARVFSEIEPGRAFWYENSLGLIEIAVNRGSAADQLQLKVGDLVAITD